MRERDLIYDASTDSYRQTRRRLRAIRTLSANEGERKIIEEMIVDCSYAITWLMTGRCPGSTRGAERRYRVRTWSPEWLENYDSSRSAFSIERESVRDLSPEDRQRIMEAMAELTMRERECFLLHHVDRFSFEEIARELHIGKSTVQTHMERARRKVNIGINILSGLAQ